MFHVKHDNPFNKPTPPLQPQYKPLRWNPPKETRTPSKYTHRKRITKKQSRIMTDREVEPHSSNSQKNFRLFSGFTWNTNSSATMRKKTVLKYHPPTTQPPRPTFHVKQLVCCRDAVFHVKHSAEYPPNPQWHSTSLQPTYPWYRFRCGRGSIPWNCGNREEWNGRPVFVIYRLLE